MKQYQMTLSHRMRCNGLTTVPTHAMNRFTCQWPSDLINPSVSPKEEKGHIVLIKFMKQLSLNQILRYLSLPLLGDRSEIFQAKSIVSSAVTTIQATMTYMWYAKKCLCLFHCAQNGKATDVDHIVKSGLWSKRFHSIDVLRFRDTRRVSMLYYEQDTHKSSSDFGFLWLAFVAHVITLIFTGLRSLGQMLFLCNVIRAYLGKGPKQSGSIWCVCLWEFALASPNFCTILFGLRYWFCNVWTQQQHDNIVYSCLDWLTTDPRSQYWVSLLGMCLACPPQKFRSR